MDSLTVNGFGLLIDGGVKVGRTRVMERMMTSRDDLCAAYLDALPYPPYPVQEDALLAWFTTDDGVLVCAPTGTGKTLIAEATLFEALHTGKVAYYTTPLIALTEQKFREIQEAAERWGFSRDQIGLVTGNRRVNPDAPILVVVAEILLNRLLHPEAFDFANVFAVVMDEFHSFNDPERGAVWELTLGMLPKSTRLMLLSATVGNTAEFLIWLRRSHGRLLQLVQSTERKVPLQFEWVEDELLNEQLERMSDGDDETRRTPALLFCFNRSECWTVAEQLKGKSLIGGEQKKQLADVVNAMDWSGGVGPKLKTILTVALGSIMRVCCRSTVAVGGRPCFNRNCCPSASAPKLAAGINLPARSIVLNTLVKGPPGKMKLIDASSAHQMFGRAGRPQFDDRGFVYALAHEDDVRLLRWKAQYDQIPEDTKDPNLIKAKKRLKKKMPKRRDGVTYWTQQQFEKLIEAPPGKLASRGELPWRLLAYLLALSPDVERLRAFVRKRLLDDREKEVAEGALHRMLLTLWGAEYIELEPLPDIERKGQLLVDLDAIPEVKEAPLYRRAFTADSSTDDPTATEESSEDTAATTTSEDDFGAGVGVDVPDVDAPSVDEVEKSTNSSNDETFSSETEGDADVENGLDDAATDDDTAEAPPDDNASGKGVTTIESVSESGDSEGTEIVTEPASQGSFGALLQQALEQRPQSGVKTGSRQKEAAGDAAREVAATDAVERVIYIPLVATPTEQLATLLPFRSVNPLYGRFLLDVLGKASPSERIQALESVLDIPGSVVPQVRVPHPDRLPPGPLARGWLDGEVVRRGLANYDELYPKSFAEEDDPQKKFGGPQRRFAIPFADKLRLLFNSEFPGISHLRTTAVWCVGDLLMFGGDFQKYVTSRDLTKQEGIIFRHLLRMILLCGEFSTHTPRGADAHQWQSELTEIANILTESCRTIDPESTEKSLEAMKEESATLTTDAG
ncbi:MAG: DEAD/DEAH box helicase [Planctomycetaceae bacterium]